MTTKFWVLATLAFLAFQNQAQAKAGYDPFEPVLRVHAPEIVFTPMGFDSNDNAQLVIYGNFPDTCYKAGPVKFRIDKARRLILIRNQAYTYSGCWCADVLVPFTQTIDLGILRDGDYEVAVERADGTFQKMAKMPIALAASSSPDDYLYAPVEQIRFTASTSEVVLSGEFKSSCMSLKDVKVNYRPNHVIEILPIAEMAQSGCLTVTRPFAVKVKIKDSLQGRALIHVRSLNGQSLNQVVSL